MIWDAADKYRKARVPRTVGRTLGQEDALLNQENPGCAFGGEEQFQLCVATSGQIVRSMWWPVVIPAGTSLVFRNVQIWVPPGINLAGATLSGSQCCLGGPSTQLRPVTQLPQPDAHHLITVPVMTPVTPITAVANGAPGVTLELNLTTTSGFYQLPYYGPGSTDALVTRSPFVSVRAYQQEASVMPKPYLTMVAMAAIAAASGPAPDTVWRSVWGQFPANDAGISRFTFDPTFSGLEVGPDTSQHRLQFWQPGWSFQSQVSGAYHDDTERSAVCTADPAAALLAQGIARCHEWAFLLSETAAMDGISSEPFLLAQAAGLQAPNSAMAMLVGSWTFNAPAGSNAYENRYFWNGRGSLYISFMQDAVGFPTWGQGNETSPGWFDLGDHELVSYGGKVWDPSYGRYAKPNKRKGLSAIGQWAHDSIRGYGWWVAPQRNADVMSSQACGSIKLCVWRFVKGPGTKFDHVPLPPG